MTKADKDKSFENLPGCAAEFIKLVIKKMRYRKKVRADVTAELINHFEDELKDCTTEQEKEQKAQKIIADFGDAKLLGILMRRAKKRCRPLWRAVVARTFQTLGVLIICLIIYLGWFLTGKPDISIDYLAQLNTLFRPVVDENLNAEPLYKQTAEVFEQLPVETKNLFGNRYAEVADEKKNLIRQALKENENMLEMLIAGTERPYYWQEYETGSDTEEVIGVLVPNLANYRGIAYAWRWRVWLSAEDGRYEDAFADLTTLYKFGRHLRGDKTLIEQLIGNAIRALSLQTTRDILARYQIESSLLAKLQSDLEEVTSTHDFAISLKLEKIFMYDELQRCFTEDRLGRGHLYLPRFYTLFDDTGFIGLKNAANIFFTHPNKAQTLKSVSELHDYWEQLATKSAAEVDSEEESINQRINSLSKNNLFIACLIPALQRVITISQRLPTEVNANLAIIAVLRYKQEHGDYPTSLDELAAAGYLKKLPIDPFSDKPLVYRKTDDGFTLYSVGENFVDDGGELARSKKGETRVWGGEGDAVFWPVEK